MKTILVLIDFSKKAKHAAEMAMKIAIATNAKVQLHTTFHTPQTFPSDAGLYPFFEDYSKEKEIINDKLKKLAAELKEKFIVKNRPIINYASVPGNLEENIKKLKPWLVVMGGKSKGSALKYFVFGSNSFAVMDKASCPVLVVPETADLKAFNKIVFATDFHPSETVSLSFLEIFVKVYDAIITVIHVSDKKDSEESCVDQYDYKKNIFSDSHPSFRYTDVRGSEIAETINKYATNQDVDLVVIAHKKRAFLGRLLHESIGKDMLNHQKVPLLILNKS